MVEYASVDDYLDAYRGIRASVRSLVEAASTDQLETICPTTPEWRVRDTLAHVAGVPADILAGRIEGIASDTWTQAQVDARRTTPIAEILDAWDDEGTQIEPLAGVFPIVSLGQMVLDAHTHELDIAHALGVVLDHGVPRTEYAFNWVVINGSPGTTQPLRLDTEAGTVEFGAVGADTPTVTISRFDFFRAATGRRSAAQIAALPTTAPIETHRVLISAELFSLSPANIVE